MVAMASFIKIVIYLNKMLDMTQLNEKVPK